MNPQDRTSAKIGEIFARINMHDLPALSGHVKEILSLTGRPNVTADVLTETILKDYSLTAKILQVSNSAYYNRGIPVTSVKRAVPLLGFNNVREIAAAIAIMEQFIKAGVEEEGISRLFAHAFLSANFARTLSDEKRLNLPEENVFLCSLLHSTGKIIICVYMPEVYRQIEQKIADGLSENRAAAIILDGLTFDAIGQKIAEFWNLGEDIIDTMPVTPPPTEPVHDPFTRLKHLTVFSNKLIQIVSKESGQDIHVLLKLYNKVFQISKREILLFLKTSIEVSEETSDLIKSGISRLRIKSRLLTLDKTL